MPNLRIKITQENTIIIERFSEELKRLIADISNVLEYYFNDSIEGQLGSRHREIVLKLLGSEGLRNYRSIRWLKDRVFLKEISGGKVEVFPGVYKLLELLKSLGIKICIVSSTPTYLLIPICDYLGISKYVDLFLGGDEVSKGKPDVEPFVKVMKLLGLSKDDVVIVGDTKYDIEPANKLGVRSVLVNSGLFTKPKPTYYFSHIYEFLKTIENLSERYRSLTKKS